MKDRIFSGIILIIFFLAIIVFNRSFPLALNIVVALISATAVLELIRALGLLRKWFLCAPALLTAAVVPFCQNDWEFPVYCLFTLWIFSAMIVYHQETTFKEVGMLYSMVVLIPSALQTLVSCGTSAKITACSMCSLRCSPPGWRMPAPILRARFLASTSSAQRSAQKDRGGAIGGVVVNVAVMLLCGLLFSEFYYQGTAHADYGVLFLIGLFGAALSILGDLSFSIIKRSCHIKDFGQVIPGHGGILDRFDSVIFTAPFVYLLVGFLPLAGA